MDDDTIYQYSLCLYNLKVINQFSCLYRCSFSIDKGLKFIIAPELILVLAREKTFVRWATIFDG